MGANTAIYRVCLPGLLALGCGADRAAPIDLGPTFARDVAPLVHRECAPCHHDGGPGPFALLSYDDVSDHGQQVAEVVASGFMPPWLPAAGFGTFDGERRLSEQERGTIQRWVEAGKPQGEGTPPKPPAFTPGWQLGTPDLVVELDGEFTVPADGLDVYRNFVLRVPDGQGPRFVRAVELRPGDPKVVHHAVLRVDVEGEARQRDVDDPDPGFDGMIFAGARMPGGRFIGWTPGKAPDPGTDARSWRLVGGSDLVLQVHLRPTGKPESIKPAVGLHFAKTPPTRRALAMELSSTAIDIPPGEKAYRVRDRYKLPADAYVLSVYPHAHYVGKQLHAYAELPDRSTKWLIKIEDWDFNWQDQYRYARPVLLPKGTVVVMDYRYDNSADNPRNPSDPPRRVVHGPASTDEMAELILEIEPARPEDYTTLDRDFMRHWVRGQIDAFERELKRNPDDGSTLATLAALHTRIDEHADARALFERSLQARPDHASTRVDYALVLAQEGDAAAAERELRRAIEADPKLARAHAALGGVLRKRGDDRGAIAAYERAVELDPGDADAHNNLGVGYREVGRLADAARAFGRAAELSPAQALFRENLGRALGADGKSEDAAAAYRAALERDPSSFRSLQGLAWILATDADLRDAREAQRLALQAARITQGKAPEVLDALAAAEAGLQRWPAAIEAASRAIELAEAAKREDLAAPIRRRLALYRSKRIYTAP